ncbi:hypothetical protein [Myroides fluvii]|uniref:hypothetical protein n=1 Tax=Myroides fluvii TaxID=2572594 RepID=UPI00131ADE0E|nr:hypothetical protein [Myroides fluvii]
MGFDISYHPINEQEIQTWYFDVLEDESTLEKQAQAHQIDEFYVEKYSNTISIAKETAATDYFDKTHGYYIAVIQGFFRTYFYTRGAAFSFLIQDKPQFKKYTTPWEEVLQVKVPNPIANSLVENYSSGVYMTAANVVELLADYQTKEEVKKELDDFYSHNRINVFLRALTDAKENNLGLLEATEVIEPNPLNLNESTCYSNLFNCDTEGALLYEEAMLEQLRELEGNQGLNDMEILEKTERVIITPEQVVPENKKGFWQRLFGK